MTDLWRNDPLAVTSDRRANSRPQQDSPRPRADSIGDLVNEILRQDAFVQDNDGTIWRYNGRYWEECRKDTLNSIVVRTDLGIGGSGLIRRRNEAVARIAALNHQRDWSWARLPEREIACGNGVFDLVTNQLRNHSPHDRLDSVIPWKCEPHSRPTTSNWHAALDTWFGADGAEATSQKDALQEFAGYIVMDHARYKRALVLLGPSNTGKSALVHVLRNLVGEERCCALGVNQMDDPMLRAVLRGARLNVITEVTTDSLLADGGFKTLVSTEDPVLINEKFKPPYLYQPTAKHVIACNSLPNITDRSTGTFNRLLVIPMVHTISPEQQDPSLHMRLENEMPGIFAWAIDGARRLLENQGRFTEVGGAEELVREHQSDQNPIYGFVSWCLEEAPGHKIRLIDLVEPYRKNSGDRNADARRVGKLLRSADFTVKTARFKDALSAKALFDYRFRHGSK